MSRLRLVFLAGFWPLCVTVALPHARGFHPALDSAGHFWMHACAVLAAASLAGLALGLRRTALAGLGLMGAALLAMAMATETGLPRHARAAPAGPGLTLLQFNTLFANRDANAVVRMIRASKADAVTLQEVTPAMRAALESLRDAYPRQLHCPGATRIGGVSVLTKLDGLEGSCAGSRLLAAALPVTVDGQSLAIVSLHLKWPWPHGQNEQVASLGRFFALQRQQLVMAGDLNAAPWSATAKRLAQASGTKIAPGYRPSWLMPELSSGLRPILGLAIDHAFAPSALRLADAHVLAGAGSDHLPVLFTFVPRDRH
ncbi:MAG: endonuclease/exonuclease/phosphatase family protein [Notoacmeibacter sp.]|nr:endonuclease/exonuclease/phosphatase family protein [Notoacmeibacter sp.]